MFMFTNGKQFLTMIVTVSLAVGGLSYMANKQEAERESRAAVACLAEGGVAVHGLDHHVCIHKGVVVDVPRSNR